MDRRLSTREANAIDPIPQRMKADENIFQWNGSILLGMENKGMVVAIRAAEITAGKENHRAEFPPPIREGGFQESLDLDHAEFSRPSPFPSPQRRGEGGGEGEQMLLHFLEGWNNSPPADDLPFLLVLDDNGRGGTDAAKGGLGQAVHRIQIVMQNGQSLLF